MTTPIDRAISESADLTAAGILEAVGLRIASAENAVNGGQSKAALFELAQLREVCAETARTLRKRHALQERINRLISPEGDTRC